MSSDPADRVPWPLHTRRLTLRRCEAGDAADVYAYQSLDELTEWTMSRCAPWGTFEREFAIPERLAHRVIVERLAEAGRGARSETSCVTASEIIGDLKLAISGAWAQDSVQDQADNTEAEIGWTVAPAWQGKGLATEAARALIEALFAHTRVRRVVAHAFADNVASTRMMESLGMQREGLFRRESLHRTRGWIDGVTYALLRDEWTS